MNYRLIFLRDLPLYSEEEISNMAWLLVNYTYRDRKSTEIKSTKGATTPAYEYMFNFGSIDTLMIKLKAPRLYKRMRKL